MCLLTVTDLSKHYSNQYAVKNINFKFDSNKCIALIGPNGAGKTTILRMLAGLFKPSTGSIRFTNMKQNEDIRSFIGYLPQYPVFYEWMTGIEFLIYCGRLANLSKRDAQQHAENLLIKVGIEKAKNQRIGQYSGGMKQRLGIAQAIIHKPKLLMLDEPVSALDPIGRREVLTLMEALKQEMTILFSTHILTDADEICDELLLLDKGEIVESGSMNDLREKYQTAKIEIGFQENLEAYKTKLAEIAEINDCYIERGLIHISSTNIPLTRQSILTIAAAEDWPITTFTINRASLEDMFMKAVKK